MKIEGPGKTQKTSGTSLKGKVSGGDGSFGGMLDVGGAAETAPAGPSQSISRVDALLSVQSIENPTEKASKQRMQRRAESILEELDKVKIALLTGHLTVGHVIDIADVVAAHREKIMDPRLTAVLDEIDLRAQIEIAKMRQALDSRSG